jgi:hypothetical protein
LSGASGARGAAAVPLVRQRPAPVRSGAGSVSLLAVWRLGGRPPTRRLKLAAAAA